MIAIKEDMSDSKANGGTKFETHCPFCSAVWRYNKRTPAYCLSCKIRVIPRVSSMITNQHNKAKYHFNDFKGARTSQCS